MLSLPASFFSRLLFLGTEKASLGLFSSLITHCQSLERSSSCLLCCLLWLITI